MCGLLVWLSCGCCNSKKNDNVFINGYADYEEFFPHIPLIDVLKSMQVVGSLFFLSLFHCSVFAEKFDIHL